MKKHIVDAEEIFKKMIQKESAIRLLEEHMANNTAPPSMHIQCNIKVGEKYQASLDQAIRQAELDFQKTVIAAGIQARKSEVLDIKKELTELEREWKIDTHTTLTQLNEEGLNPYPHVTIDHTLAEWINILKTKQDQVEKKLRTNDLLKRRAKQKWATQKAARLEEERTNMILEQPAQNQADDSRIKAMELKVKKLERQLATALPKGGAKPTKAVGGGQSKKPNQKQPHKNGGKGNKAKPGSAKDTQGRPGPSKRSTRQ